MPISKARADGRTIASLLPEGLPELGPVAPHTALRGRLEALTIGTAFDAARIGPAVAPGFGKVHYAVGPGVRFSLVTLDFTAGYAFNLNRQPNERRGSLMFSMTISDLFR